MAPVVRVDEDVWGWLKSHARPLEDTPNSVLRRLAGLDRSEASDHETDVSATPRVVDPGERKKKGHHNAQLIREQFAERLRETLAPLQGSLRFWSGAHRSSKNLFEITVPSGRILLYVKVSDVHGFWGLNPNQLQALRSSGTPWAVVLLLGPAEDAYLLPATDVVRALEKWSRSTGGEYKINIGPDLKTSKPFAAYGPLVEAIGRLNTPRAA